jgi:surfeit locus 1 family protein
MTVVRLMFSRKWILTTLLVVAGSAICVRLGLWQLERLAERQAFNAHYLATSALPMLEIASTPQDDLSRLEYRRVEVSGSYDFNHQVVLRNQYHQNQLGYFLLTPLLLSDGTAILVQRGWIPAKGNEMPANWRKYDRPGIVTVSGILRLSEPQAEIGGVPDATLAPGETDLYVWNFVNLGRIAQQLPYQLLPVFVQPDPEPARTQPPYPYQPEVEITEGPHFGYAMQWFTFAALLFFGYPLFYLRQQSRLHTGKQAEIEEK